MYLGSLISQNHFNIFECFLTFRQSCRNNVDKVSEKHFDKMRYLTKFNKIISYFLFEGEHMGSASKQYRFG